jgi:hypothetical protein
MPMMAMEPDAFMNFDIFLKAVHDSGPMSYVAKFTLWKFAAEHSEAL